MEGAAPHNKNVTVDELLVGSFDEEDGKDYIDEEWYKKTGTRLAESPMAKGEEKKRVKKGGRWRSFIRRACTLPQA